MGAWIEISQVEKIEKVAQSHPTMGAWIEIVNSDFIKPTCFGRTPRWVRGLKSIKVNKKTEKDMSHPTMGAWIEITFFCCKNK